MLRRRHGTLQSIAQRILLLLLRGMGGGGGGVPWPGHQSEPSFFPLPFSPFVCVRPVRCG